MARESETGSAAPDRLLEEYIEEKESGGRPDRDRFFARCATERDRDNFRELIDEYERLGDSLPEPDPPSHVVAGYRLVRKLGQGGMGVVYAALSPSGEDVALKLLPPRHDLDPSTRDRLEREIEILRKLDHPDIVKVLDRQEQGGELVLVLELLDGGSLADRIQEIQRRHDPPTPSEIESSCRLVARVARAVHAAHEQGVLHRDIKPSNILFDGRGGMRLADFGLAHLDAATKLTTSGKLMGTAAYMAPERMLFPGNPADPRGDVYSLGITLYESIALTVPFKGSITEILSAVRRGPPPLHLFLGYRLDRRLEAIVEKSVADTPGLRYSSAAALASDLDAFLEGRPVLATRARWRRKCSRAIRRRPLVTASIVGTLLLALGIGLARASAKRERLAASLDTAVEHVRSAETADRDMRLMTDDTAIHDWSNLGQNAEVLVDWEARFRGLARQAETERDVADPILRRILVEDPSHEAARTESPPPGRETSAPTRRDTKGGHGGDGGNGGAAAGSGSGGDGGSGGKGGDGGPVPAATPGDGGDAGDGGNGTSSGSGGDGGDGGTGGDGPHWGAAGGDGGNGGNGHTGGDGGDGGSGGDDQGPFPPLDNDGPDGADGRDGYSINDYARDHALDDTISILRLILDLFRGPRRP